MPAAASSYVVTLTPTPNRSTFCGQRTGPPRRAAVPSTFRLSTTAVPLRKKLSTRERLRQDAARTHTRPRHGTGDILVVDPCVRLLQAVAQPGARLPAQVALDPRVVA